MRSLMWIILVLVAAPASSLCRAAQPSTALDEWETIVSKKGTNLVFDVYGVSGPQWPKGLGSATDKDKLRQDISPSVIRDARRLVHGVATASDKQLWARIDACLRIRDSALQDAGYADLVLADALTRAGAVALCKQLGCDASSRREFEECLTRLRAKTLPITKWCGLAQNEFGFAKDCCEHVNSALTEEDAFRRFWNVISTNSDAGIMPDVEKSGSLELLAHPNLPLLFYRTLHTDLLVKTLVVASNYKSRTSDFSLNDTEEKIALVVPPPMTTTEYSIRANGVQKKKLPLDPEKYTIGERLLGCQISYPEVARLLRAVATKEIEKQLFYDISEGLAPQAK